MELLRMGKVIGPDKDKLSAEDTHNWQLVTYANGQQGYVDLADAAVVEHVLSDADFPYWLGWQKKDGGLFGSNGQCDMHDLLDVLKVAHDGETGDTARQQLRDYFNDAEHRHVRDWAQRMVCRYPSEWDKRNNARCGKLKEKDGLGPGKDGPYVGNDDEFEKHMQFVEALQWWEDVGLGDSNVWHFHPLGFISHMRRCGWLDTGDMAQCFPRSLLYLKGTEFAEESTPWRIASATADRWHVPFNRAARRYGISRSKQRLLHVFAHVIPETGNMRFVREINGEHKKYSPYYGRGLIQLTHLETYQRYGRFRTLSDAACPQMYRELGWDPDARIARDNAGHFDALNCADSACFYVFWRVNMLNHLDHGVSQDDATIASKDVNGYVAIQHLNGLDRRLQAVLYLKTVLLDELRAGDSYRLTFHWRRSSELEVFLDANGNPIMDPHTHQVKRGYIAGIHTIDAPLTPQRP